jgi:hypothetical protein
MPTEAQVFIIYFVQLASSKKPASAKSIGTKKIIISPTTIVHGEKLGKYLSEKWPVLCSY